MIENVTSAESIELTLKVSGPEFVASCNRMSFVAREKMYKPRLDVHNLTPQEATILLLHLLCKSQVEGFDIAADALRCLRQW